MPYIEKSPFFRGFFMWFLILTSEINALKKIIFHPPRGGLIWKMISSLISIRFFIENYHYLSKIFIFDPDLYVHKPSAVVLMPISIQSASASIESKRGFMLE